MLCDRDKSPERSGQSRVSVCEPTNIGDCFYSGGQAITGMGRHAWSLLIIRHSRQLSKPREAWCSKKPRTAHFIFCVNCEILQNMTLSAYWRVSPPKKERKKSEFPGILERLLHTPFLQKRGVQVHIKLLRGSIYIIIDGSSIHR